MRLVALLVVAAAASAAAASLPATGSRERFVPADGNFIVANVATSAPDAALRTLLLAWRENPAGAAESVALATAYLQRARSAREPAFFGRAEAVLAPLATAATASAAQRRLYAETLQFRHQFAAAEALLDEVLRADARDAAARTQRASVRLVRGDFPGARTDCAQLVAAGDAAAALGIACLSEALAGNGQLARARQLLNTYPADARLAATARAYLLAVRGELAERAGEPDAAAADYAAALALAPEEDSIRAALADALAARGDVAAAREVLDVARPALALLVRAAVFAPEGARAGLARRAAALLELEAARGDAAHLREAALLALGSGDAPGALAAARANFTGQRELADVRVLARAADAARDGVAMRELRAWMDDTGFEDVVAAGILAHAAGG